jgi:hypothetical protein
MFHSELANLGEDLCRGHGCYRQCGRFNPCEPVSGSGAFEQTTLGREGLLPIAPEAGLLFSIGRLDDLPNDV